MPRSLRQWWEKVGKARATDAKHPRERARYTGSQFFVKGSSPMRTSPSERTAARRSFLHTTSMLVATAGPADVLRMCLPHCPAATTDNSPDLFKAVTTRSFRFGSPGGVCVAAPGLAKKRKRKRPFAGSWAARIDEVLYFSLTGYCLFARTARVEFHPCPRKGKGGAASPLRSPIGLFR